MDPYVGEIRLIAGNYAPRGWALCNGQVLLIQQNSILFSVIGIAFGGNGTTTFALPDLRGRAPIHQGAGPGLTNREYASEGGNETVTLTEAQIPNHTHAINNQSTANTDSPIGAVWANLGRGAVGNFYSQTPNVSMNPQAVSAAGGSQPHNNMQPFVAMNYIIALEGVYPPKQ
ncbi:phage tail protein [Paenibacillus allorhizosphaerae]|uniref:Phage tail collar domain-containing protein n=1 Tax=Paenibacillus allorhizosphaerae TaxID=2849866 RepID=A0ABN7TWL7_9BACL|nr:tail fiber protein [Paenibacillus allorhizosphaerae]CAG7658612.1 hypothetical protein PAECIP111802_07096 [Paenibacillus allorhizosphaerae]